VGRRHAPIPSGPMSWFLDALKFIESREGLKYITGAALGAAATSGLNWRREHRRSLAGELSGSSPRPSLSLPRSPALCC
jgi:hypothetical protein